MICLARKTPKDGKEENIRVRVTPEQKQRLVEYAERHYQSMSGVVCQAFVLSNSSSLALFVGGVIDANVIIEKNEKEKMI